LFSATLSRPFDKNAEEKGPQPSLSTSQSYKTNKNKLKSLSRFRQNVNCSYQRKLPCSRMRFHRKKSVNSGWGIMFLDIRNNSRGSYEFSKRSFVFSSGWCSI